MLSLGGPRLAIVGEKGEAGGGRRENGRKRKVDKANGVCYGRSRTFEAVQELDKSQFGNHPPRSENAKLLVPCLPCLQP